NGRVDTVRRDEIAAVVNGNTAVPELLLPTITSNRPPVVLVPTAFTLAETETREITFVAGDPDEGQRVVDVRIGPPHSFVSIQSLGDDRYILKLTPKVGDAGTYNLNLTATDNLGATLTYAITVRVTPLLVANAQTVTTPEDTPVQITLTGSGPIGQPLT